MNILHLDSNHPLMIKELTTLGFENTEDFTSTKAEVEAKIHHYDGVIIRSRLKLISCFG